jgi:hypothetical protein
MACGTEERLAIDGWRLRGRARRAGSAAALVTCRATSQASPLLQVNAKLTRNMRGSVVSIMR